MRTARAALALLLAFAVPVRAETTTDPLWYLLSTYVLAPDAKAVSAEGDGPADAKGLAALQADLLVLTDGLEAFRDESQVKETLERLKPRMSPELKPFFKDRASSLDAIYRTLAVADYTWALRFPEPPCEPASARRGLLDSRDGLFQTGKGESSPWLVSLLGPQAEGKAADLALEQAASRAKPTGAEYEKIRARVRKLTFALASDKAVGGARAKLYCARAAAFTNLAGFHRATDSALISAARAVVRKPEESVFVVVWKDQRVAATLLRTKNGTTLVTDAAIVADTDHPNLFAFSENAKPVALAATVVRRHPELSVAVLSYTEEQARPALALANDVPSKDDLVTAVGHTSVSGLWTKTSGLVTKVGEISFQTDAAISPELSGGPVLNEAGEVAGMLVLRPADTEEGRWPVAISAPVMARWLDDPAFSFSPAPATEAIEDAGTAALLSRARPSGLTEAGLGDWNIPSLPPAPSAPNGVCVANCGGSNSSGSSNGSAELGQALGELGAVLILKGIPALFRGIGKLLKSKGGNSKPTAHTPRIATTQAPRAAAVRERPPEPEKPKEPARLTGLTLEVSPPSVAPGETVTLTARVSLSDPEAPKANIPVSFMAAPETLLRFSGKPQARTDAAGIATISATLRRDHGVRTVKTGDTKAVIGKSDRAQSELDDEVRAMSAEESGESESSVGAVKDEEIRLEASAKVGKSLSATTTVVLADVKTKPECRFEPVDVPESVGDEPFSVKMRFSCTSVKGLPEIRLDGHEVVLAVGLEGQDPQHMVTLHTDAGGNAFAVFQTSDSVKPLQGLFGRRADDRQFINAANPGAVLELVEPVRKVATDPTIRQIAVTGGAAAGIRIGAAFILNPLAVGTLVVVGGTVYSVVIIRNQMRADQERYDKGLADSKADNRGSSEITRENCPPCKPFSAGTIGYIGPHSDHPHFPVEGPHLNLFVVNQNPKTCKCFWNKNTPSAVSPPPRPGWVDLNGGQPLLTP